MAGCHACGQSSVGRTVNQSRVGGKGTSTGLYVRELSSDFLSFPVSDFRML